MLDWVRTQALPERTRLPIVRPNFQGESLALKISRSREDGVERGDTHQHGAEPSLNLRQRNRGAGMPFALGWSMWSMWLMCFSRQYSLTLFPIVAPAKHVLSLLKGQGPSVFPAFEVQG